jgi:Tfp pilus assembly protein PilF
MVVGLYEDALEPLKEAVKVKPDYAEAHRVLSLMFKLTGFTEQSEFHKKEASRLNPDFTG